MGDEGLETIPASSGKTSDLSGGGAESGALDPGLAVVIDAWPALGPHRQSIIVGMARKASDRAKNQTR